MAKITKKKTIQYRFCLLYTSIARDCLALTMQRLQDAGYNIVMHIHDEVVVEVPKATAEADLKLIKDIMDTSISWADGLKLNAEAFISEYYKKD